MSTATLEHSAPVADWPPPELTRRVVAWCEERADRIQAAFYAGVDDIPDALVVLVKGTPYDFDFAHEFNAFTKVLRRDDGFRFYPFMTGEVPENERAWYFWRYDPANVIFGS